MKALLFIFTCATSLSWAQFSVNFLNDPGEGFFSTEAVDPVGNNPGTTVGEQRRLAFLEAIRLLEIHLQPEGPVAIDADFRDLEAGVLGQTNLGALYIDFPEAPEPDTWYPAALANHLTQSDLETGESEIFMSFNTDLDNFYYGFDFSSDNEPVNFISTCLHEIAHGLGFSSVMNGFTGAFPGGSPDIFSAHIYDLARGQFWRDLNNTQRAAAATGGPFTVWAGRGSELASDSQINDGPQVGLVEVDDGLNDLQTFFAGTANFGENLTSDGITGQVILVDDGIEPTADACETPFTNAAGLDGKIALIDRGDCFFADKVQRAEDAGAIAVIIMNNIAEELMMMTRAGSFPSIPSVLVTQDTGVFLRTLSSEAIITIRQAGINGSPNGQPLIHTPTILDPGSSVSHWDQDIFPNLLMEPAASVGDNGELDLTLTALRDIGWNVSNIPFPNLDYELWEEANVTTITGKNSDADDDGHDNFSEYAWGSNPEDETSIPSPLTLNSDFNLKALYSSQAADIEYILREGTQLNDFQDSELVFENLELLDNLLIEETLTLDATSPRKFYQLEAREK